MKLVILGSILFLSLNIFCQNIIIDNTQTRKDINGNFIDLHDGRVIQFGNRFYWYGTSYGNTSGFVRTNKYHIYSSSDMVSWKAEGPILKNEPSGIYYRPHVVYNSKSKKYILWYNWYPYLWTGKFGVAVADSPIGPFEILNEDVKVSHSDLGVGDFNLFVDEDNKAYLSYNTINGHKLSVEELDDTYLQSTMKNGGFIAEHCEAGSIFRRDKNYYLLTDYTCCFCTQGSGARVYISEKPMSGFVYKNNINRNSGSKHSALIDRIIQPDVHTNLTKKDGQFPEIEVIGPETAMNKLSFIYFTGNRSGTCGDTISTHTHQLIEVPKIQVSSYQNGAWKPVETTSLVKKNAVFNTVELNFATSAIGKFKLSVDSTYPYSDIHISEIEAYLKAKKIDLVLNGYSAQINDIDPYHGKPIIPAQQTYIMELNSVGGKKYIWMGDLWGSAPDNIKGHDIQYWSEPLEFEANGNILSMKWKNNWSIKLKK